MSIKYYSGDPTIVVENPEQLAEALDILHTQVMDNFGEDSRFLRVLEDAMERVEALQEDPVPGPFITVERQE